MTERADAVLVDVEGGVAVLTLNRPAQLNAFGTGMARAMHWALDVVENDAAIGAFVIDGAGRAFCAGADIAELEQLGDGAAFHGFIAELAGCLDRIAASAKPSVAAVHGLALGGGLELALACDLRVVAAGARLGVPEIKLGLLPGLGGTQRLPRLVPPAVARHMLLTGDPLDADEAVAHGLATEVVAPERLAQAARELATSLAAGPRGANAVAKQLLARGAEMPLAEALELERQLVAALFDAKDRIEGMQAFRERRQPRFGDR